MYAPVLEIDTRKVTENARRLHGFCAARGVELAFVTKGFSARPEVIRAALAGGITRFADSRLKNIAAAKTVLPGLHYLLIRIPAIDEAEDVVRWADWSLQSQIEVIRAVSDAALRAGKIHPIILMIDVGDLREGVFGLEQLREIAPQIRECKGVELVGLGTNVGCYGSILPSVENTGVLVRLRDFLNETYGFRITTLSGGSTCTLRLLEEGVLPEGINHLRVGEAVLYGEDTTGSRLPPRRLPLQGPGGGAAPQAVGAHRGTRPGRQGGHPRIPRPGSAPAGHLRRGKAGRGLGRPHPHSARGGDDRRQLRPPDCGRGGLRRADPRGGLDGLPLRLYGRAGRHHLRLCGGAGKIEGMQMVLSYLVLVQAYEVPLKLQDW